MAPGTDRVPFVCLPAVLTDRPLLTHNVLSELSKAGSRATGEKEKTQVCVQTQNPSCLLLPSLPQSKVKTTIIVIKNNNKSLANRFILKNSGQMSSAVAGSGRGGHLSHAA